MRGPPPSKLLASGEPAQLVEQLAPGRRVQIVSKTGHFQRDHVAVVDDQRWDYTLCSSRTILRAPACQVPGGAPVLGGTMVFRRSSRPMFFRRV